MSAPMLVTGATGTVGRRVVQGLLARGIHVRAASRDPRRLTATPPAAGAPRAGDIETVQFDLEDSRTFRAALHGVERVFLIARPGDDEPHRLAIPFLDAARSAGVRHVVNLTAIGVEEFDEFPLRLVERYLESSGMHYTHLRPNWFMQIFADGPLHAQLRDSHELRLPLGDARVSYVDVRDIAALAVAALSGDGHEDRAYTITGPEAMTADEVVSCISVASGRSFRYVAITDEEARALILSAGLGPARAERLLRFYALVRAGLCARVSDAVERVAGHMPLAFDRFAEEHAVRWH